MSDYFLDYVRANQRLNYATKNQEKVGNEDNQATTLAYPSDDATGGTPTTDNKNNELSDIEVISVREEIAELLNDVLEALFNFFKENDANTSNKAETKAYPSDDAMGAMPPSGDIHDTKPNGPDNNYQTDDKKPATKAFPSDDAVGSMPPSFGTAGNSGISTMAYPSDDAIGGMP